MSKTTSKIILLVLLVVLAAGCLYWRSKVGAPPLFTNNINNQQTQKK